MTALNIPPSPQTPPWPLRDGAHSPTVLSKGRSGPSPGCRRCRPERIAEPTSCRAASGERGSGRRLCWFATFSLSVGGLTVLLRSVLWGYAVSTTRKRKAPKEQGQRKNIQELKTGNRLNPVLGKPMMMSNWKRQRLTSRQRTQPALGQGKIVQLIQRCSRVAGVRWGSQERTEKQGAQLKTAPRLQRMQETKRRQRGHEATEWAKRSRLRSRGALGTSCRPCPGVCWAWRERGSCLRGTAAVHRQLDCPETSTGNGTEAELYHTESVNRRCGSFSLVWGSQPLFTGEMVNYSSTWLPWFLLFVFSLQLVYANDGFIWHSLILCCYMNNIPALRVFSLCSLI